MSNRFVVLRRYTTQEEANRAKAKLSSEGIPTMVVKEASQGPAAGVFLPVRLMVRASDQSRALSSIGPADAPRVNALSSLLRTAALVLGALLAASGVLLFVTGTSRIAGVVLMAVGIILVLWSVLSALVERWGIARK
jgi:hypothetical protein